MLLSELNGVRSACPLFLHIYYVCLIVSFTSVLVVLISTYSAQFYAPGQLKHQPAIHYQDKRKLHLRANILLSFTWTQNALLTRLSQPPINAVFEEDGLIWQLDPLRVKVGRQKAACAGSVLTTSNHSHHPPI